MSNQKKKGRQGKGKNTAAECRNEHSKTEDSELNAPKRQRSPEDYEREIDELKHQLKIKDDNIAELKIELQKRDILSDGHNKGTKKKREVNMEVDETSCSNIGACREENQAHSNPEHCDYENEPKNELFSQEIVKDSWDEADPVDFESGFAAQSDHVAPSSSQNVDKEESHDRHYERKKYSKNSQPCHWGSNKNPGFRNERDKRNTRRTLGGGNRNSFEEEGPCDSKIKEINGDLFTAPKGYSLAHCVAQDLKMGSGIAVNFKREFKRVDELMDQRKKVGQVAILDDNERFVYYLITKKYSEGKPRMIDLRACLECMKEHTVEHKVKNLAIPRIGCGLDKLNWKEVCEMLADVFSDLDINIVVFNFNEDPVACTSATPTYSTPKKLMRIKEKKGRLISMEPDTLLILFGSVNGSVDDTMDDTNTKFPVISDYKSKPKKMGDIIPLLKNREMLCILIVKEDKDDVLSYISLRKSLQDLRKLFKKEQFYYMAFEAFLDNDDDLAVSKTKTCFNSCFSCLESELWICWPPKYEHLFHDNKGGSVKDKFSEL